MGEAVSRRIGNCWVLFSACKEGQYEFGAETTCKVLEDYCNDMSSRPIRLGFVGDLAVGTGFVGIGFDRCLDISSALGAILPAIKDLDVLCVNLEGPLFQDNDQRLPKAAVLSNDPTVVAFLKEARSCICNLGNNHSLDYGFEVCKRTCQYLAQEGILAVGVGSSEDEACRPVVVEQDGCRVGFISFTSDEPFVGSVIAGHGQAGCGSFLDEPALLARVKSLAATVDHVVVFLHWGYEYYEYPSPAQVSLAHLLAEAGADLVIGHHPHVIQGSEVFKESRVFYSLGNFFLPPFRLADGRLKASKRMSKEFLLVIAEVHQRGGVQIQTMGGVCGGDYVLRLYQASCQGAFQSRMRALSRPLSAPDYTEFWMQYQRQRDRQLVWERRVEALRRFCLEPVREARAQWVSKLLR